MPAGDPSSRATARTGEVWEHGARRWSRSDQLVGGDDNDRAAEMLGLVPGCWVLGAGCGAGHRLGPLPWELEPLLTHHAWHLVYQEGIFGQDRDGNTNPVSDPTVVDPTTWTPGLQALANGWRFLAIAR